MIGFEPQLPRISVVICAHNPDLIRLRRVLTALRQQTLAVELFEVILIDNGSEPPLDQGNTLDAEFRIRIVAEGRLGLSYARARGFTEAAGNICILVDDDNVLAPDYLASALSFLDQHPDLGLLGGPCRPEFDAEPAAWTREFFPLLALRDLGSEVRTHPGSTDGPRAYPDFSPTGAGMVIRTNLALAWQRRFEHAGTAPSDRRGTQLSSAGDNDIVLHALALGAGLAYLPALEVTHLLPSTRLAPAYLARLNEGIQKSWMQVLRLHGVNPWPAISRFGAWLRIAKCWLTYRAWQGHPERIRFAGAKGHFLGRVP